MMTTQNHPKLLGVLTAFALLLAANGAFTGYQTETSFAAIGEMKSLAAPAGMRLPFVGSAIITNGPECGPTHLNNSREAVDFVIDDGLVRAAQEGIVIFAGWNDQGFGNLLKIQHPNGTVSFYAHLASSEEVPSWNVFAGDEVNRGDIIAVQGNTGYVIGNDGTHLHFEVHQGPNLSDPPVSIRDLEGISWYSGDANHPCKTGQWDGTATGPAVPPQVSINAAWTTDSNGTFKSTFAPGETVGLYINVQNPGNTKAQGVLLSDNIYDPNFVLLDALSRSRVMDLEPGMLWRFETKITLPNEMVSGSYTYLAYGEYNGHEEFQGFFFDILPGSCSQSATTANLANFLPTLACQVPTPTPPPPSLPPSADGIEIVRISSHEVSPNETFNPVVTIRLTSGSLGLGDHLHATPEGASNLLGAWPVQPIRRIVRTGETYTFDINNDPSFRMTAPSTAGAYQSVWQLRVGGNHVGPRITIPITVKANLPPPDATPPDTTITTGSTGCTNDPTATFTFGGSDDRTPISELSYAVRVDNGTWSEFLNATSTTFTGLSQGEHTVFVVARDRAGNVDPTPATRSFNLDTIPPTTSASLNGIPGNNRWYRSVVTVILSATDIGCGSANIRTEYAINNAGWLTYTGPVSINQEGRYIFSYRSVDGAGNVETISATQINIDWTPPITTGYATGPRDINGIFRDVVSILLSVVDNLSGKDYTQYSFDGGITWQQLQGSNEKFAIDGNGTTRFLYRSVDMAGNVENTKDSGPIIINKYVVFSNGAGCSLRILNSTSVGISGDLHGNGCVDISNNTGLWISGTLNTVSSANNFAGNTNLQIQQTRAGVAPVQMLQYPLRFYEQFATVVFPTDLYIDAVNKTISGTVYVKGNIFLQATTLSGTVTLISEGDFRDETTTGTFNTADPYNGVVMFSGGNIELGGTTLRARGLWYAPNGTIRVNGATTTDFQGSMVANQVELNAATTLTMTYEAAFASGTYTLPLTAIAFTQSPVTLPPLAGTPNLIGPAQGAAVTSPLGLTWEANPRALGYQLQIATSASFELGTLVVNISRLDSYHRATLSPNTQYFWRARAINQAGISAWSSIRSFSTTGATLTPTRTPTRTAASPAPTNTRTPTPTQPLGGSQLLTSPWNLTINGGAVERYQGISPSVLGGKNTMRITYNLRGCQILGGDASAIIFDQGGQWRFISLSNYGQNGYNGQQVVDIPLSHFAGLNPNSPVGTLHTRFWHSGSCTIDITSVLVYAATGIATNTPTPTRTWTLTASRTATASQTPTRTATPLVPTNTRTPTPTQPLGGSQLLTLPWVLNVNGGAVERYQAISSSALVGKNTVRITYDLHGCQILGGDASAIIFDQGGQWRFISLSNYGLNGYNGQQVVDIPLSHFPGLNPNSLVGTLHTRFWHSGSCTIDITSILVYN